VRGREKRTNPFGKDGRGRGRDGGKEKGIPLERKKTNKRPSTSKNPGGSRGRHQEGGSERSPEINK